MFDKKNIDEMNKAHNKTTDSATGFSDNAGKRTDRRKFFARKREKADENLIKRLVSTRRVAKVVRGGTNFSFSSLAVVGDGNGKLGIGNGKALEVSDANRKATERGTKSMKFFPLKEKRTVFHRVWGICGASKVLISPAPIGAGIAASKTARSIFEAVGIKDVVSKSVGSNNPINVAKAVINGLSSIETPMMRKKKLESTG